MKHTTKTGTAKSLVRKNPVGNCRVKATVKRLCDLNKWGDKAIKKDWKNKRRNQWVDSQPSAKLNKDDFLDYELDE